jgi:serine protease Do
MRRVNIKYFAATIVLILVFILGVGCEYLPSFSFSTSTSTTTPATTPPPINSTYTLTTTTPTKPPSTTSLSLPDIAAVVAKVKPSVVAITSQITSIFGTQNAEGSGWIIDSNGLIVTNNHVVEGAKTVTATLEGGQIYTAKSIRTDPINDLAVIDIGINNLPAATVGDSSELRVGDWVVAIGNALGQGIRATQGIISATGITITVDTGTTLYNLLETTAAINPGNSGGPLVNMRGEVVGITSAKLSAVGIEGMGYAISSNTAKPIIEQLIQQGYATRPLLGVNVSNIAALSQSLIQRYNISVDNGAVITQITAGGPADKAGLKVGDVIVSFGGKQISGADDLVQAIRSSKIGQQIEVIYWRGNSTATAYAILIESPPSSG